MLCGLVRWLDCELRSQDSHLVQTLHGVTGNPLLQVHTEWSVIRQTLGIVPDPAHILLQRLPFSTRYRVPLMNRYSCS